MTGPRCPAWSQGCEKATDFKSLTQGSGKEIWFQQGLWEAKRELPMNNQTSTHFPYVLAEPKFTLFA